MSIIVQLKKLYEQKKYYEALDLLNRELARIKKLGFNELKDELNKIESAKDFQVIIRFTDHFLMFHYSSFLARYAYRRFPDLLTTSWYCEELLDHGKLLEADDLISQAIEKNTEDIYKNEEVERLYFCKIRCLLEMKRNKEAEKLLEMVKQSPRPINDKLGYIYMQMGNRDIAEKYYQQGLENQEKGRICCLLLADLKAATGQIEEGLKIIKRGEDLFPETPAFLLEKVRRLRDLGKSTEMLEVIRVLNELIPDHAYQKYFHHLSGIAYYQLGDFERLESYRMDSKFSHSIFYQKNDNGELIKLNIKPIIQKSNYCVPASLEMIMAYYGVEITQDEIAQHIFDFSGSKLSTTVAYLEQMGYECRYFIGNKSAYLALLRKNIPVLLSVDFEHSSHVQLLTGYDSRFNFYHIQDPNLLETIHISDHDFEKANAATSYMSIVFVPKERKSEISFLPEQEDQYFRKLQDFGEKMEEDDLNFKELFFQFLKNHIDIPYTPIYVVKHFSYEEYQDFILQCVEILMETYSNNDFMNLHVSQAYMRLHMMEKSMEQLKLLSRKSFSPLYHFLRGRIALYHDQLKEAEVFFRRSLELDPDQYYAWSYLALSYLYLKVIDKAEYFSLISMELAPKDRFVRMNHAAVLIEMERYEEAKKMYDQLLREEPRDGHVWYERARLDQKLGKTRKALKGFLVSIKHEGHVPYAYLAAADLLEYELEQKDRAVNLLLSGIQQAKTPEVYVRLGDSYLEQKMYLMAEKYYKECIDLFPKERFAYIGMAEMIAHTENQENAILFIDKHTDTFKTDSEFLINIGRMIADWSEETENEGLLEKAVQFIEQGINLIHSNLAEALELYVRVVEESPFADRAIHFLQQKFNENKDCIEFKCYEGTLHEDKHQYSLAIDCYKAALDVKEDSFPYYRLGEVYYKLGQNELAANGYKKCLNLNSRIERAYLRLAEISSNAGNHSGEANYLMDLFDVAPISVDLEYLSSIMDEEEKQVLLAKVQKLPACVPEFWRLDGEAYVHGAMGNHQVEEEYVAAALAMEPERMELLIHKVKLLIKTRKWNKVLPILEELLFKYPEDEEVYQTLVKYAAAANKWSKLSNFLYKIKGEKEERSTRFLLAAEAAQQYILDSDWMEEEEGNAFGRFVRKLKNRTKQISLFGSIIELYETAVKLDKGNLAAISRFAKFYESFHLEEDAIKVLQKSLKTNWDDRLAYQLGMNYLHLEEYHAALPLFERQLNNDYEDTHLQYLVASILIELGDIDEAEKRLTRIVKENPFENNVHFRLGWILNEQERIVESKEVLEQGLKLHPFDYNIQLQLSVAYRNLNNYEKALEMVNEILDTDEWNLQAHYLKACYLVLLNRHMEAKQAFEVVLEHDESGYFTELARNNKDLESLFVIQN